MTESHIDATNTEEHQEHQNDMLSSAVTTGISLHSTYTSTTLHSTSNRDSAEHDQRSETLPTDMSDTTESDAEKQTEAGVCVCVCVCVLCARTRVRVFTNIDHHGT